LLISVDNAYPYVILLEISGKKKNAVSILSGFMFVWYLVAIAMS